MLKDDKLSLLKLMSKEDDITKTSTENNRSWSCWINFASGILSIVKKS